jgi:polygalacturonase
MNDLRKTDPRGIFNVTDFGATGDGQTLDTAGIQAAIAACHQAGGGTVAFPAGNYVTGAIFLRSNITLLVDAGARLLGSQDPADYPLIPSRWEGASQTTHASLISGSGLENIAVTGRGTIDGRGAFWWKMHREKRLQAPRPRLICFEGCFNVLIEGVTLTNSPSWTIHPLRCTNVNVDKVTVINPYDSPNTDGINPDSCRYVHISNCYIDVGDDCITIKSGTEKDSGENRAACENITVANCTMAHGHGGVVIGSEMSGDVRNVTITNCVFIGTDRGIRLKSRRGRGGVVEDIRVSNLVMKEVLCPFTMNLYYAPGAWGDPTISDKQPHPVTENTPRFRRIHYSHITARGVKLAAGFLFGLAEMPVEEITFSDISVEMAAEAEPGYAEMADDIPQMGRAGFFVRNARGLRLHNLGISNQQGPALDISDSAKIEVSACTSLSPSADSPIIRMNNVSGAWVHGCQAAAGTSTYLALAGSGTREILLSENFLARAARPVQRGAGVTPEAVTQ